MGQFCMNLTICACSGIYILIIKGIQRLRKRQKQREGETGIYIQPYIVCVPAAAAVVAAAVVGLFVA